MIKRKKFKSGDIIEVCLKPYIALKAYFKYIDFYELGYESDIHQVARVFNTFSNKIEPEEFPDSLKYDLLCNPISFAGSTKLKESLSELDIEWKIVKEEKIYDEDLEMMLYREKGTLMSLDGILKQLWYVCSQDDITGSLGEFEFEQVKHLEYSSFINKQWLPFRIYLEYLKMKDIDLRTISTNIFNKNIYEKCWEMPKYNPKIAYKVLNSQKL